MLFRSIKSDGFYFTEDLAFQLPLTADNLDQDVTLENLNAISILAGSLETIEINGTTHVGIWQIFNDSSGSELQRWLITDTYLIYASRQDYGNVIIALSYEDYDGTYTSFMSSSLVGCTDSSASNYDAAATYNDGSCVTYSLSAEEKVLLGNFSVLPFTRD